jgi:hypothetical protein
VAATPVRGTQSFVGTLSSLWKRPSLTALEVAWRWSFGAPALALMLFKARGVLLAATGGTLDPARLGLDRALLNDPVGALSADPMAAVGKFARAVGFVAPGVEHVARWLVPLLLLGWVVQSAVGRTMLLARVEPAMKLRVGTLMVLHALRIAALCGIWWVWFSLLGWSSRVAVLQPIAQGAEPNLVLYCGLTIVFSLGVFSAWATLSWVLHMAPLLAMLRDLGPVASLAATLRLGALRAKLVEINLVLGIVKIALVVLAMVFSASPLPFESVESAQFLAFWWAFVALLYLAWSDFFHVARLVGYLDLWRVYAPGDEKISA